MSPNAPLEVVGTGPGASIARHVLVAEGLGWLRSGHGASRVAVLAGQVTREEQEHAVELARTRGQTVVALGPYETPIEAVGGRVRHGLTNARMVVDGLPGWEHGPVPLLCPRGTANALSGASPQGYYVDAAGRRLGDALFTHRLGHGRVSVLGHWLPDVLAGLRHGFGSFDHPDDTSTWPLYGPRHLYRYVGLSEQLPRDVPVADLHQDVLRTLVLAGLQSHERLRLWHFPEAAPSLSFIKADGCGEAGTERLVDDVEAFGARLTFYAPPRSRFSPDVLRSWVARGHGVSIEADLTDFTQVRTVRLDALQQRHSLSAAEVDTHLREIAAVLRGHRRDIEEAIGTATDSVCFHGCQWTGDAFAQLVADLGWTLPTHFISHDPRMRIDDRYGCYMIPSALPLPYLSTSGEPMDLLFLPAQWDESQTLGAHDALLAGPLRDDPDRVHGIVGLTGQRYGDELARGASDSARRWHGVQIMNFHAVYVYADPHDPRWSWPALERALRAARRVGSRFSNLEDFARFARARNEIELLDWQATGDRAHVCLRSPEEVAGATFLTEPGCRLWLDGREVDGSSVILESRSQRAHVVDLSAGATHRLVVAAT